MISILRTLNIYIYIPNTHIKLNFWFCKDKCHTTHNCNNLFPSPHSLSFLHLSRVCLLFNSYLRPAKFSPQIVVLAKFFTSGLFTRFFAPILLSKMKWYNTIGQLL